MSANKSSACYLYPGGKHKHQAVNHKQRQSTACCGGAPPVPDIPPEERFRTSYSKQFPAYDVRALFAEDRKAIMPARYVPAGNRQLRDLESNFNGRHVQRNC
ncbi:unnamed protein product [Polarella glacialis]|uniref:Uncharacterized protein n=1 Tax=Polarella glacialis TaxID=89957 RepID=A0A813JD46_POLGL|nr:unnamed protein product [Polarella glacialis]